MTCCAALTRHWARRGQTELHKAGRRVPLSSSNFHGYTYRRAIFLRCRSRRCPNKMLAYQAKVAANQVGIAEEAGFDDHAGEPYGKRICVGTCPRCKEPIAAQ